MNDQSMTNTCFEQIAARLDPHGSLLRFWRLHGGVSAEVTAMEIAHPDGRISKAVVRRHGPVDLKHNPDIAADEFRLLAILHGAGIAVPQPLFLDRSATIFPTPYLVVAFVEGTSDLAPDQVGAAMRQSAAQLAGVHCLGAAADELAFLPQQTQRFTDMLGAVPARPADSLDVARLRHALANAWPLPQRNAAALLHGDFWPGNLLWQGGQLAAILDWEDAALGDPLADVANARLELLWAFGSDAMQLFTHEYRALTALDFTDLPYWELCAALRLASNFGEWASAAAARTMRERHRWFVDQAFEQLERIHRANE